MFLLFFKRKMTPTAISVILFPIFLFWLFCNKIVPWIFSEVNDIICRSPFLFMKALLGGDRNEKAVLVICDISIVFANI